jgi:predicted nucleic acid-binding protein
VPSHGAGEFLEGAACVSEERFQEALVCLALFDVGAVSLETAKRYAGIVSDLRRRSLLEGASKPDLWIAEWALEHGARLVTRNRKRFEKVQGLTLISY